MSRSYWVVLTVEVHVPDREYWEGLEDSLEDKQNWWISAQFEDTAPYLVDAYIESYTDIGDDLLVGLADEADTLNTIDKRRETCTHVEEYRYWSLGQPGEPDQIICRFCGTVLEEYNG